MNLLIVAFIVAVKKTFRYTNVFSLHPLMPPFLIPGHKYEKRYKRTVADSAQICVWFFCQHCRFIAAATPLEIIQM